MPTTSSKQWGFMGAVRSGKIHVPGLSPEKAAEFQEKTPENKRKKFAKVLARRRK